MKLWLCLLGSAWTESETCMTLCISQDTAGEVLSRKSMAVGTLLVRIVTVLFFLSVSYTVSFFVYFHYSNAQLFLCNLDYPRSLPKLMGEFSI